MRVQFWMKHRGRVDVLLGVRPGWSAEDFARHAVRETVAGFNRRWPAAEREELHCIGIEDPRTGRQVLMRNVISTRA